LGEEPSRRGSRAVADERLTDMRQGTVAELEDWERNGAEWRPAEIHADRAVVDLCSCTGELMDRVESEDPAFVALVRARRDE
jgi:hypothetical protein